MRTSQQITNLPSNEDPGGSGQLASAFTNTSRSAATLRPVETAGVKQSFTQFTDRKS